MTVDTENSDVTHACRHYTGYQLGAFDYLLKPFDQEAILTALTRIPPQRGRFLVVDDDPQAVDLIRQLLEGEPYEAEHARLAQSVRAVLRKRGLDRGTLIEELQGLLRVSRDSTQGATHPATPEG